MQNVEKKLLEEISRYNSINKYIFEQEATLPPPPGGGDEPVGDLPPAPEGVPTPAPGGEVGAETTPAEGDTTPVDTETDPDVEKINSDGESEESEEGGDESEELDITDLVNSQKEIQTKQDDYFEQLFSHLENLESKLGEMDALMNKVNSLEEKLDKYRPKTPQEKLELRSLDSGPYNQKLSDFFIDKEPDMERSGKNEYILTTDEVESASPSEIRDTFNIPTKKNFGF